MRHACWRHRRSRLGAFKQTLDPQPKRRMSLERVCQIALDVASHHRGSRSASIRSRLGTFKQILELRRKRWISLECFNQMVLESVKLLGRNRSAGYAELWGW